MRQIILKTLVNSRIFQRLHDKYSVLPTKKYKKEAYAQCGEDIIINFIISSYCNKEFGKVTYLEVGTNNPVLENNTYLFYTMGGSGVLIEPNPELCKLANQKRPKDTVICAGIAFDEKVKSAPFYMFQLPYDGWNGFDESRVELAKKAGVRLINQFNQKLIPINEVLDQYFADEPPVIVSIDVEGFEMNILNTINFERHRPVIFCIESDQTNFEAYAKHPIIDIMAKNGYLHMANTSINMIFLEKSYFNMEKFFWAH